MTAFIVRWKANRAIASREVAGDREVRPETIARQMTGQIARTHRAREVLGRERDVATAPTDKPQDQSIIQTRSDVRACEILGGFHGGSANERESLARLSRVQGGG
jgi:hypothetical protein